MMTDFLEVIVLACLATTLFFGGWQVPWLAAASRDALILPLEKP